MSRWTIHITYDVRTSNDDDKMHIQLDHHHHHHHYVYWCVYVDIIINYVDVSFIHAIRSVRPSILVWRSVNTNILWFGWLVIGGYGVRPSVVRQDPDDKYCNDFSRQQLCARPILGRKWWFSLIFASNWSLHPIHINSCRKSCGNCVVAERKPRKLLFIIRNGSKTKPKNHEQKKNIRRPCGIWIECAVCRSNTRRSSKSRIRRDPNRFFPSLFGCVLADHCLLCVDAPGTPYSSTDGLCFVSPYETLDRVWPSKRWYVRWWLLWLWHWVSRSTENGAAAAKNSKNSTGIVWCRSTGRNKLVFRVRMRIVCVCARRMGKQEKQESGVAKYTQKNKMRKSDETQPIYFRNLDSLQCVCGVRRALACRYILQYP